MPRLASMLAKQERQTAVANSGKTNVLSGVYLSADCSSVFQRPSVGGVEGERQGHGGRPQRESGAAPVLACGCSRQRHLALRAHFADGGYFYDAADGRKYYGADIGKVVRNYSLAFPDLRRDIHSFYFDHNVVVAELSLIGTHRADLVIGARTVPATGRQINVPCCDV